MGPASSFVLRRRRRWLERVVTWLVTWPRWSNSVGKVISNSPNVLIKWSVKIYQKILEREEQEFSKIDSLYNTGHGTRDTRACSKADWILKERHWPPTHSLGLAFKLGTQKCPQITVITFDRLSILVDSKLTLILVQRNLNLKNRELAWCMRGQAGIKGTDKHDATLIRLLDHTSQRQGKQVCALD